MTAAPQAAPATYSLIHHTYDGRRETSAADYAAGWSVISVTDAPKVTAAMVAALRKRVVPHVMKAERLPTRWDHCDPGAWAAVTDLFQAGCQDDALDLAVLPYWCDQRFTGRVQGVWEIGREGVAR